MKVSSKRESRHYSVDICGIHQSLILTFGWLTKACWCGVRTQSLLARGPPWSNRRCRSHSSSRLQSSSGSLPSLTSATRLRIHSLQCLGLELRLGHARRGSLRGCRAHRLSQSLLQDRPQHHVEPSTPYTLALCHCAATAAASSVVSSRRRAVAASAAARSASY